jgi:hypothetical protein
MTLVVLSVAMTIDRVCAPQTRQGIEQDPKHRVPDLGTVPCVGRTFHASPLLLTRVPQEHGEQMLKQRQRGSKKFVDGR